METKDMTFDQALELFVERLQKAIDAHTKKHFPNLTPRQVDVEHGRKFAKVVTFDPDTGLSRSVHSFVVKKGGTTKTLGTVLQGDILKAASWKQPARHVRGSIFSVDYSGYGVTEYGAQYL